MQFNKKISRKDAKIIQRKKDRTSFFRTKNNVTTLRLFPFICSFKESTTFIADNFSIDNYSADMTGIFKGVAIEKHDVGVFAFFQ